MEKKINLEEIFSNNTGRNINQEEYSAMKEACRQALELASENAVAYCDYDRDMLTGDATIDKQSILNTINQIE